MCRGHEACLVLLVGSRLPAVLAAVCSVAGLSRLAEATSSWLSTLPGCTLPAAGARCMQSCLAVAVSLAYVVVTRGLPQAGLRLSAPCAAGRLIALPVALLLVAVQHLLCCLLTILQLHASTPLKSAAVCSASHTGHQGKLSRLLAVRARQPLSYLRACRRWRRVAPDRRLRSQRAAASWAAHGCASRQQVQHLQQLAWSQWMSPGHDKGQVPQHLEHSQAVKAQPPACIQLLSQAPALSASAASPRQQFSGECILRAAHLKQGSTCSILDCLHGLAPVQLLVHVAQAVHGKGQGLRRCHRLLQALICDVLGAEAVRSKSCCAEGVDGHEALQQLHAWGDQQVWYRLLGPEAGTDGLVEDHLPSAGSVL